MLTRTRPASKPEIEFPADEDFWEPEHWESLGVDLGNIAETRAIEEPARLEAVCNPDGSVTLTVDSVTAARLGGRHLFGHVRSTQKRLQTAIADAWYAADCPPEAKP